MGTKGWIALLLGFVAVACCSCEEDYVSASAKADGPYLRYNLHYVSEKGVNKGSYANWTQYPGHGFLPYNSKIRAYPSGSKIRFVAADTGMQIAYEYNSDRMGMSSGKYIQLVTSPTPVTYEGLSDADRKGIEAGQALVGMSKQAVMIALGYPAKHQTPSLEMNRWTYWKGRHQTYLVEFDESGKVTSIGG